MYTLHCHSHDFIFSLFCCVCWPFTSHLDCNILHTKRISHSKCILFPVYMPKTTGNQSYGEQTLQNM